MIVLLLEEVLFEQDIRELCMAFYPGETYAYEKKDDAVLTLKAFIKDKTYVFEAEFENGEKAEFSFEEKETRSENKNLTKKGLYGILTRHTKKELPWGTLTGIRPTKLVMEMLEKNFTNDDIRRIMKESYLISDSKLELCLKTALKEKMLLDKMDYKNGFSLYIGIPFCPTTCAYCSFTSYPIDKWKNRTGDYISALCKELREVSKLTEGKKLQTVYMGGGTPSSISEEELDEILNCLSDNFDLSNLLEISVEAGRPDSITKEKFEVLKKHKVGRISINPQTMHDRTLELIGRRQTVEQFKTAFRTARAMGFDNINTDIILGLPKEDLEDVKYTMDELLKLAPESITVHTLAIKRAAKLNTDKESYYGMKLKNNSEMIDLCADACAKAGLFPYYMYRQKNMIGNFENVAYAKPGTECIYNILIMEEKQTIIACGAGTSTKIVFPEENRLERIENVKDPKLYIERLEELIDKKKENLGRYYGIG